MYIGTSEGCTKSKEVVKETGLFIEDCEISLSIEKISNGGTSNNIHFKLSDGEKTRTL